VNPAWKAYHTIVDPAWKAYRKIDDPAYKAYCKKLDRINALPDDNAIS